MSSFINVNNKKICFNDQGKGKIVVLLHGYLESLEIWNDLSENLSEKFRVISFDIPGHGESNLLAEKHSMEIIAKTLNQALKMLDVNKCFMIGHSMGGYVTLMFHNLFPEMLSGFSLFHSHPFADTEETKRNRLREIELVKDGRKDLIATFNTPLAFASDNKNKFQKKIEASKKIALKTSEQGIIANLHAMISRPDLSENLKESQIPFLYIVGKKDNYIDYNTVVPKIKMPIYSELKVLKNSGHMGFIEEKTESVKIINNFIQKHISD